MVPYTTGRTEQARYAGSSSSPICPYCGKYLDGDILTVTSQTSIYKTETPSIAIREKPSFDFIKKIGNFIEKKVLYNVWKPIRG
jgi:hypothetical protein